MTEKFSISERALLTWLAYSVSATIVAIIVTAVSVYFVYGCWILSRYSMISATCIPGAMRDYIMLVPVILGMLVGGWLTLRFRP